MKFCTSGLIDFRRLFRVCLILALSAPVLSAQLPGLKVTADGGAKADVKAPAANDAASLEKSLKETQEALIRMDTDALPTGVAASELESRRHNLEQARLLLARAIKNAGALADARKKLESSKAEEAAWSGFKETPPYSILMVDEVLNERDAVKNNISSQEASLANTEGLLASAIQEAKLAEADFSRMVHAAKNADEKSAAAAKWRMEAARENCRLQALRVSQSQDSVNVLKERLAAAKVDLVLVERKASVGRSQMVFSDEDMNRLHKNRDEHRASLKKEQESYAKRLKAAISQRDQAQAALAALGSKEPAADKPADGLELAKFRAEVAEGRVELVQSLAEAVEYLIQLEDGNVTLYQHRRNLLAAATDKERAARLEDISALQTRLKALESVLATEQSALSASLGALEARAAGMDAEDPRQSLVNDQRAFASERLSMIQRLQKQVGNQRKLARRWINDFSPDPAEQGWSARFRSIGAQSWGMVRKLWHFELTHFEEKTEIDGKVYTNRSSFTLGTLVKALMFFVIGYWLVSRIANRVQKSVLARGYLAEAQTRTLRNWGMMFASFFLVLGTFEVLRIPLTVFAFLGGALAIGIGFGTQTIIKNFISGIILLVERKIRVGDVLEVEGFIGKVTEINTRSSVLRSADDMETIVPNSVFLENRVTNWTLSNAKVRRILQVGVAYGSPVQTVMEVLTEVAERHGLVSKDPSPFSVLQDFGDNALVFHLYYWLDLGGGANGVVVASDLRLMIEKRFGELQIQVPFPQRDMRLSAEQPLKVFWAKDAEASNNPKA